MVECCARWMGEERRETREKFSVHGCLQTFPSLFSITGPDSGCQLRRGMCMRVGPAVGPPIRMRIWPHITTRGQSEASSAIYMPKFKPCWPIRDRKPGNTGILLEHHIKLESPGVRHRESRISNVSATVL